MDQPPLDNRTDLTVHPQVFLGRDGEQLLVIVKATYELMPDGVLERALPERMRPLWFADVPWGKPEVSSIAYHSDIFLRRPGTDVLVVGEAHAPRGEAVPSFDVMVRVGSLEKACKIFGLRVWEKDGAGLTPPRPIRSIEMRYDYAWGGFDDSDSKKIIEEPRNPVGLGMVREARTLTHQPAPNIEDPRQLISDHKTRPPPAGLGPCGRNWEPRRRYVGTYDQAWQELRAPLPPKDFDDRYNVCASPGLHADAPLRGGEQIALLNLVPGGGATKLELPRVAPLIEFRIQNKSPEVVRPALDTLVIDTLGIGPDKPLALELCYRASVKAPRRLADSRTVVWEE